MSDVRRVLLDDSAPPCAPLLIGADPGVSTHAVGVARRALQILPVVQPLREDAIRTHGAVAGPALAAWRFLRCNPFGPRWRRPCPAAVASARMTLSYTSCEEPTRAVDRAEA